MLIPGLYHLLPELRTDFFDSHDNHNQRRRENDNRGGQRSFTRLQQLCVSFLRAIATPQQPVAIFLDDLQWADDASLQIVYNLVCSPQLDHILWIASFRDDTHDHVLALDDFVAAIQGCSKKQKTTVSLAILELQDLDLEGTSALVRARATPSLANSRELSEVIHHKTNGNPYFVEQFLKMLLREGMMSRREGMWTWNMDRIRTETHVSDNIVDLVTQRIQKLSSDAQKVLQIAAFLGYRFDVYILQVLAEEWLGWKPVSAAATELQGVLKRAVREGLVDRIDDNRYKFSHDRVQQSLFALVEERISFHYMIGTALYREWDQPRQRLAPSLAGDILLLAADHLNQGRSDIQDHGEKMGLVRLNQEASQWSVQQCAFGAALAYLRRGKELLGDDELKWRNHYELSLQLSSSLGDLEVSNGDHDQGAQTCQDVLDHATCLDDKLEAYTTLIHCLGRQEGKLSDSIDLGRRVLRMLGAPLPKNVRMRHMLVEIMRTRRTIAAITDVQLLRLSPLMDKKKLAVMKIMHKTGWVSFADRNSKLVLGLTIVILMRMTCRYGYTEWTPAIMARYGGLEAALGNLKTARRLLGISMQLIDESKSKAAKAQTMLSMHSTLSQWFQPYSCASDGFCRSYVLGVECGDFELALSSASHYLSVALLSRLGLAVIESEARTFCQQAKDFNLDAILAIMLPLWQYTLNLLGESDDPAKLTGEAMVEEEHETKLNDISTNGIARQVLVTYRVKIAWHFGNWSIVERLLDVYASGREKALRGHLSNFQGVFLEGLLSYILLERQCTPERKYLRRARQATKQVQTWAQLGVPDCQAIAKFLLAEQMALNDKKDKRQLEEVMKLYTQAMNAACHLGSLQIEAMFAERVFEVLLNVYGDDDRAMTYLCKSIDLNSEWQAHAKVVQLREKRRNLLHSGTEQT